MYSKTIIYTSLNLIITVIDLLSALNKIYFLPSNLPISIQPCLLDIYEYTPTICSEKKCDQPTNDATYNRTSAAVWKLESLSISMS